VEGTSQVLFYGSVPASARDLKIDMKNLSVYLLSGPKIEPGIPQI
jgi:hypothetical protein